MQNIIWEGDNVYVTGINYRIETLNYELERNKLDVNRATYRIGELEIKINLINKTLRFLKREAKIVDSVEYRELKDKLVQAKSTKEYMESVKWFQEMRIGEIKDELVELSIELKRITFKLLEFPGVKKS